MPARLLHRHRPRKANGRLSTTLSRLNCQWHLKESKTAADTVDGMMMPDPFPFFKLPTELRIIIYRLVVVTRQDLIVRDMHLAEFEKIQHNSIYQSRSAYLTTDHVCDLKTWPENWPGETILSCLLGDARLTPKTTTYTLGKPHYLGTTTTKMLSLDKRSREEVTCIFYGENTFHFVNVCSFLPFMRDRTMETRKYIHRVRLTLTVDDRYWDTTFWEYGRPATWNTALSSVLKLSHVNIKKLCIEIDDRQANILRDGLNLRSKTMLWLHKLSRLGNLEMLGLKYRGEEWRDGRDNRRHRGGVVEEINTDTERELWSFLAPKMLEKEADDHSPDALQQRRIWDFSHNRKSHQNLDTYDFASKSGFNEAEHY